MTSAPQSERRRGQDDAHMARRWSVDYGRSSARTHQASRPSSTASPSPTCCARCRSTPFPNTGGVMITVMADGPTYVDLIWIEKRVQRWIRFGRVASEQIVDRRRSIVAFAPGDVFAFVRWASNDFGTVVSRIDILRAVRAWRTLFDGRLCPPRRGEFVADIRLGEGRTRVAGDRCHRGVWRRSGRRRAGPLAAHPQPPDGGRGPTRLHA